MTDGLKDTNLHRNDQNIEAGALNLLENCARIQAGQSVLIVGENDERSFFDPDLCQVIANTAHRLGASVQVAIAPETSGPDDFPEDIAASMRNSDHTVFLSRLGDQLRFCSLQGTGTKTMCYTFDKEALGDLFGRLHHQMLADVRDQLIAAISATTSVRIECPLGTELEGSVETVNAETGDLVEDFSVRLFPVMIIPPLCASGLSGRVALGRWLLSTSTHLFDGRVFELQADCFAHVDDGRINRFEGPAGEVARIEAHFRRFAGLAGGDPFALNSWHAGINPTTFYRGQPENDIERWSDAVFGSPRYTHFHACGTDPGVIALSVFDATISFDGEAYWDKGRFSFLDKPSVREIIDRYPQGAEALSVHRDIGI